jgi:hypothetical protein
MTEHDQAHRSTDSISPFTATNAASQRAQPREVWPPAGAGGERN